eukprot:TRINITY_DN10218_c0_g1_i2.p1 TRINITY_DN10218_c0_g1~~TRINITY_DN10218_c0_g1_i2.p1  ORF type:complete len:415 (+),score=60.15 TRINITY_DN10218_c0_g1_i2:114-1358(+)
MQLNQSVDSDEAKAKKSFKKKKRFVPYTPDSSADTVQRSSDAQRNSLNVSGNGADWIKEDPGTTMQMNGQICIPSFHQLHDAQAGESAGNSPMSTRSRTSKINCVSPKVYNVSYSKDLVCYERLENMTPIIKENYNRLCPYCLGYIDLKKCNFQNVCAFHNLANQRYYVMHFDCYTQRVMSHIKITSLCDVPKATYSTGPTSFEFDPTSYIRVTDKQIIAMSLEIYHPLSNFAIIRTEKILPILEHISQFNQIAYCPFTNGMPALYEPNMILIPMTEFRCVATFHQSNRLQESVSFEFSVDLSEYKFSTDRTVVDIRYTDGMNKLTITGEGYIDLRGSLSSTNYKLGPMGSYQFPNKPVDPGNLRMIDQSKYMMFQLKNLILHLPMTQVATTSPPSITIPVSYTHLTLPTIYSV